MNRSYTKDKVLEEIKTNIDLVSFVVTQGYEINNKKTSLNSTYLESKTGDSIVITKSLDNHFVYFNPNNVSDSGSILDFVMNKQNKTLWEAKKELENLIGVVFDIPKIKKNKSILKLVKTSKNAFDVIKRYSQLQNICKNSKACDYLLKSRFLKILDYINSRFEGKIKTDRFNAVIFPHFNINGVIGWEAKNWNFTGCPRGSDKGIWASNRLKTDESLVITESGIDCLSYYALKKNNKAWYISTGGGWSQTTKEMLLFAVKIHSGDKIILAFDNDKAGEGYREDAKLLLKNLGKEIVNDVPVSKDWNDDLREKY